MTRRRGHQHSRAPRASRWLSLLQAALLADRPRLRGLLDRAARAAQQPPSRGEAARWLREFRGRYRASRAIAAARSARQFETVIADGLPIAAWREQLKSAIATHQVTIVCGATGSGKSTQLPKICLDLGRGVLGRIGMTQPRRLAARTIAARIAQETRTSLGTDVGYQTRFEQVGAPSCRLKVMTDGILLQEIHHDRLLLAYDTLIIDEVHERSVNVDLLLGYLRKILPSRPELRVILTSATIEAERYAGFFDQAVVVDVPGRGFPIELRYRPPLEAEEGDYHPALLRALQELDADDRGDVLIFLPGEREIFETRDVLQQAHLAGTAILPLYARLGSAEQQKIFAPHVDRHIVLATNVAETSLTVPGIRHVIDTGLVRISSYSPRSKLQRLPVVPNSQASADQRKGRCGRERPGICVRLYSEEAYAARTPHTEPEFLRSNLAAVVLRLAELALPPLEDFPLLDPPQPRAINDGYNLLRELGALDDSNRITPVGRKLARLPLDPQLARIVLAAAELGCLREALVVTAGLSAGDVRDWPREQRAKAQEVHAATADRRSEFSWLLRAWADLETVGAGKSRRQLAAFCRERFWSWRRAREWQSIHAQLSEAAARLGLASNAEPASYRTLHVALLAGFAARIGRREEGTRYLGTRKQRFRLHPASALREKPPRWLVAAEITETTAAYARLAAAIEPEWVVAAAAPLIRRTHSAPSWDAERGRVLVREAQSLFGLTLAADVVVDYAALNAADAQTVFIQSALVEGGLGEMPGFLAHNQHLLEEVAGWEARTRRHDLRADVAQLVAFYRDRLPPQVSSRKALKRWLATEQGADRRLRMQWRDVTQDHLGGLEQHLFPAQMDLPAGRLDLHYVFAPGEVGDGLTVDVPVALLSGLRPEIFERLVPGLFRDKVFVLLKSLPKEYRRVVSPMNEFANALTAAVEQEPGPLLEVLSAAIRRITGSEVPASAFRPAQLEAHQFVRFRVVGADSEVLAEGRDLPSLQAAHADSTARAFRGAGWKVRGESRLGWTFGDIPEEVASVERGIRLVGYPALSPADGSVRLVVEQDPAHAQALHCRGLARLLMLSATTETRYLRKELTRHPRVALAAPLVGWRGPFADSLIELGFLECVGPLAPRTEAAFHALLGQARTRITALVSAIAQSFTEQLLKGASLLARMEMEKTRLEASVYDDLRAELQELLGPGGLALGEPALRRQVPRYLRALELRVDRLLRDPAKDSRKFDLLVPALQAARALEAENNEALRQRVSYLLQELRVAVFAPELKTAEPVSVPRVLAELRQLASIPSPSV